MGPVSTRAAGLAADLRRLHHQVRPLVLANAWDAASARAVEAAGFPAVATSSAAVAASLGFDDGGKAPADEMFAALSRITHAVRIPVTADIEDGYGLSAGELVARLLSAGAVGCNLEDSDHGDPGRLVATGVQADRLAEVRDHARRNGVPVVVNARVDTLLRQAGPPGDRVAATLARMRAYLDAGADCVYPIAPGADDATLAPLVEGCPGPVNLLARPDPADVARLAGLGAARISVGSVLFRLLSERQAEVVAALAAAAP